MDSAAHAAAETAPNDVDQCMCSSEAQAPLQQAEARPAATGPAAPGVQGAAVAVASQGSGGFLFTPRADELQGQGAVGLLARLVFWARWRLGEPVIVRGVKVCGCAVLW